MDAVTKARVVLMTRQGLLASGLRRELDAGDIHFSDLSTISDLDGWMKMAKAAGPSVVIVDCLSRIAFKTVEEIRRNLPEAHVLLWVMDPDLTLARKALDIGVRGLVKSDISADMLRRCIQRVNDGELWFDRTVSEGLMNSVAIQLSRREYQLLVLVSNGLSNKEIADALARRLAPVEALPPALNSRYLGCVISSRTHPTARIRWN